MAALSIADVPANVTIGVDTHKHSHIARAKDGIGRHLGQLEIETNPCGYAELLAWAQGFGSVVTFGIEGTSSYGAGLTRFLRAQGQAVIEVLRPVRRDRRFGGKSDPIDADAAAGAVLSGKATAVPKAGDAGVEMVRALKIAKQTAIKARTQAVNAVKGLVVMAPDPIREQLRHLKTPALVRTCSAYRVDRASDPRVIRCRPGCGRDPGVGGRKQWGPSSFRGSLLNAVRRIADFRLVRHGSASPAQSRRRPPGQCSVASDRGRQAALRRGHQGIFREAQGRGQIQKGDLPLRKEVRGAGGLHDIGRPARGGYSQRRMSE
jgi:hypothetical protein